MHLVQCDELIGHQPQCSEEIASPVDSPAGEWRVPLTVLLQTGELRRHGIECDETSVTYNDRSEVK